ncbi:MAG: hypothetical protein XD72_2057 [Methanothrix harundinacea]|uniref:Uncharacterized protein n=1 Tax=Methanothrix harundinacea TaxID=301375 RepID=A0A101FSH8_9EURY|nr:MAG: hypothetical protein XD72_2057 [Methanothrix harundinacea]
MGLSVTCLRAVLKTKDTKAAARSMPRSSTAGCAAASLTKHIIHVKIDD